jgi:adenosylhomocysteine nucleosidase
MKIGIIGAMDEELASLTQNIKNLEQFQKGGHTFWHGEIYTHEIYLTRCDPGKVNAAISTQKMIDHFSVNVIFNMGSSGANARELEVGDLVIATEAIQHDFDLTAWGLKPGELIFDVSIVKEEGGLKFRSQQVFHTDPQLTKMALNIAQNITLTELEGYHPKIYTGRIISGDQFIHQIEKANQLWNTYQSFCTDMEAAAIAHTCTVNSIPFLCIRAISDKADRSANISFAGFLVAATANYGKIFDLLTKQLDNEIL